MDTRKHPALNDQKGLFAFGLIYHLELNIEKGFGGFWVKGGDAWR